ncbi:metal-dependent hydrolase [Thermoplasmatales archaeon ex4484_30]|nr:MAG: metal-dependent hydrolase [Thermoplasmatales archaeon ex4484_30]
MSILIKAATIVTQDSERNIIEGDVYIEDGRIVEIGKINVEADYVVKKKIVMPGLINTHTHLPMTLMRGYGDDLTLEEWLTTRIWPIEKKLDKKMIKAGTRLAFLEMISTGTTCCADMYFFENAIAEVANEMKIRCFAGFSIIDFDTPEMKKEMLLAECEKFIKKWKGNEIVKPVVAPHSTYSCSPETLQKAAELARKYDILLHTHCSETRKEVYDVLKKYGSRPLEQLKKNGVLTEKTILAHCGWITKEEVKEIARAKACVSHNPVSNMKLATGGFTPLPELFDANAIVTLGTDGAASNNKLDMFETMKFAALIHKHHRWDASVVTAQQTLDMATINASKFFGIDGSIEEGKKADIICLEITPNLVPRHNIISHIVYAASGFNVSDVIINGKMIMNDRKFIYIDKNKIMEEAEKAKEELLEN